MRTVCWISAGLFILMSVTVGRVQACEGGTCPPVRVVGHSGWTIVCRGVACAGILRGLPPQIEPPPNMAFLDDRITQDQFCEELRQANPNSQSCSLGSPPSVPGIDPGWVSNGCGDGSIFSDVAHHVAGLGLAGYQGNLNYPFPGISFYGACRSHDACYGSGDLRDSCDVSFFAQLQSICGPGSYQSGCARIAERFRDAVSAFGASAYAAAVMQRDCAAWARDMEQNGCSQ